MAKISYTRLLVNAFCASRAVKAEYGLDKIRDAMEDDCTSAIEAAESDEAANEILNNWAAKYPHVWETPVDDIPAEEMEAAFGEGTTPDKQAALVKKYGAASVTANAKRWGTTLGATKPGRDPERKAEKKAPANGGPTDSKTNPWSDQYRCPRPPRDAADRLRMIREAQETVIKRFGSAGAIQMARSAGKTLGGQPLAKRAS